MALAAVPRYCSSHATLGWWRNEAARCTAAYRVGGVAGARTALVADTRELLVRGGGVAAAFWRRIPSFRDGDRCRAARRAARAGARGGTPRMPPRGGLRKRAGSRATGCRVGRLASKRRMLRHARLRPPLTRRRRAGRHARRCSFTAWLSTLAQSCFHAACSSALLFFDLSSPRRSGSSWRCARPRLRCLHAPRPPRARAAAAPAALQPLTPICARRRHQTGYATQLAAERAARAAPGRGRHARHRAAGVPQPGARACRARASVVQSDSASPAAVASSRERTRRARLRS
jgi:hypothetical protein